MEKNDDCRSGRHAVRIIADAIDNNHGWIAMSDHGEEGLTFCARGNTATMSRMMAKIGAVIIDGHPAEDSQCRVCNAHFAAVKAAALAYTESLRTAGLLTQAGQPAPVTCH